MTHADDVTNYCVTHYLLPARERGDYSFTLRAGDIHKEMEYSNRLPLVCSAIGSQEFENRNRLKRISIDGPLNGSNTLFTFLILDNL